MPKAATTKTPRPFWREARKCWYVQIDGTQHKLSANKNEAMQQYHHLMATHGRRDNEHAAKITVAQAVERLTREKAATHRKGTVRLYVYNLGPFAEAFQGRRLSSIEALEVIHFVRSYPGRGYKNRTFGDSSRWLMFRFVKTLFRWARDTGLIDVNPLHGSENPWMVQGRPRSMTPEEYARIMGDRKTSDQFKEVLEFLWRTGARPGEIACIQARHLDAKRNIVRLQPAEYKTGRRTGLQREIIVPQDLMARLRGYAAARPQGRLLRNRRNNPWDQERISDTFGRVKRRLKLDESLVIYMARHGFITRKLEETKNPVLVAKMVGHTDTTTIQRVYYHPDLDDMDQIVNAQAEAEVAAAAEVREKCRAERKAARSVWTT